MNYLIIVGQTEKIAYVLNPNLIVLEKIDPVFGPDEDYSTKLENAMLNHKIIGSFLPENQDIFLGETFMEAIAKIRLHKKTQKL